MAKTQTEQNKTDDARREAWAKEHAERQRLAASGWKDGAAGRDVQADCTNSLAYVAAWVNGRKAYNSNVRGTHNGVDGDPYPGMEDSDGN